jgi:GNAT superfamily N-acetyltransferase
MHDIVVRQARPDEYGQIGELAIAAYATLPDVEVGRSYEASLRDVATRAATNLLLVAELHGQLVGTATYVRGPGPLEETSDPEAGSIRMVGVHPDARGQGVAQALVEACIAEARNARRKRFGSAPGP